MTVQYRAVEGDKLGDYFDTPEEACDSAALSTDAATIAVLTVGDPWADVPSAMSLYERRWRPVEPAPEPPPPYRNAVEVPSSAPPPPPPPPRTGGDDITSGMAS